MPVVAQSECFASWVRTKRVRSESRSVLDILPERGIGPGMPKQSLEFHTGIAIPQFEKNCGQSAIGRTEFNYHVAMRKLCEGDRVAQLSISICASTAV